MLVTAALMLGVYTIVDAHSLRCSARSRVALLGGVRRPPGDGRAAAAAARACCARATWSGANVVQLLMVAGMLGMFFLAVLYLQRVLGYDAIETGTAFLPVSVAIGTLSLGFSARLNTPLRRRAPCCSRRSR